MKNVQTTIEEIDICGMLVRLHVVSNTDELFDELVRNESNVGQKQEERIPYWADLWPSSIGLSRYLSGHPVIKKNMRVLEIGCGLGLAGIVAGKLEGQVTFTDYLPEALEFARKNWDLNSEVPAQFSLMDWRRPDETLQPELILASDIAYEKKSFPDLVRAFHILLKPGGQIIISEPNRAFAQDFFAGLALHDFTVHSSAEIVSFRGMDYTIRLHMLKKSPEQAAEY